MGWLLLWTAIIVLALAVPVACCWMLWHKARALLDELRSQGRTVGELIATIEGLGLAAERPAPGRRSHENHRGEDDVLA